MTSTEGFPLLEEWSLPGPTRRLLRWWRDPASLPAVPPGAALVFRTGDGRFELPDGGRLSGYEEILIDATAVGVVDCRGRAITVRISITSLGQSYDFPVLVTFGVKVNDAATVFRDGITDLNGVLVSALRRDEQLTRLSDRFAVHELVPARAAIRAHVTSAYSQRPPQVRGMSVTFRDMDVETPEKVRTHAVSMQDRSWDAEKETFDWARETQRVEHVRSLTPTPEALENLAIARGERNSAEAAQDAYTRREKEVERLWVEVRRMEDSGEAHRDPVDRQHLVNRLDRLLTGSEPPPARPRQQAPRSLSRGDDEEPPVYVPLDDYDED